MFRRNNEERTGSPAPQGDTPPVENQEQEEQSAPILNFTTPTELVDIPSKGLYYPEGHPLHKQESIEIKYMTAKDEDILTSKSYLKKGIAIDKLLQNVIVNKSIDINSLLSGDKNALIIAARTTGYGSSYQTKMTCPSCGAQGTIDFDLEEESKVKSSEEVEGVQDNGDGTFVATTPRGNIEVKMRLLDGSSEKKLLKLTATKKKNNQPESTLSDQLRLALVSVGGQTDQAMINMFIRSLPASDARYLRDVYSKKMPNVELKHNYECHSCGYEQELEVPFTSDFFWPK
jgi:rubredoxin